MAVRAATQAARSHVTALAVGFALVLGSCAVHPAATSDPRSSPGRRVITSEMILESRANNVWDLLREHALVNTAERVGRGQFDLQSRRGRSSLSLRDSDVPLVIVDGVRVIDLGMLRQIPAQVVRSIRLLSAIEGTTYMGTNSGAGVIVIETSARST